MPLRPEHPPRRMLPRALLVALGEAGVDLGALARELDLGAGALEGPLSADQADALLSRAVALLPPWFGLSVGVDARPELFGVVGLSAMTSPTFQTALERLARYKRVATGDFMALLPSRHETAVRFRPAGAGSAAYVRQKVDCELAFVVSLGRRLTRAPVGPVRVSFEHSRSEYYERYASFFGCPMLFDRPASEVVFKKEDLARPLASARPELAAALEARAEPLLSPPERATAATSAALRGLLNGAVPRVADVARVLRTSERNLQRQLQGAGTSFRDLVDEARDELARLHVKNPELTNGEVAYLLGFSHPNAFYRAFKRWTGTTPDAYRRAPPGAMLSAASAGGPARPRQAATRHAK